MERGRLIVLNGGSSAGKTSLARAFQDAAPETWLHLGIDLFWFALPPEQLNLSHVSPGIDTTDRPPRLLALELLESVEACPEPSAFAQLRERFETRG